MLWKHFSEGRWHLGRYAGTNAKVTALQGRLTTGYLQLKVVAVEMDRLYRAVEPEVTESGCNPAQIVGVLRPADGWHVGTEKIVEATVLHQVVEETVWVAGVHASHQVLEARGLQTGAGQLHARMPAEGGFVVQEQRIDRPLAVQ